MDHIEAQELLPELDGKWKTLNFGSPIPGLYPQNGTEQVRIKGLTVKENDLIRTEYTIVISDQGNVIGTYHVVAEEDFKVIKW